MNDNFRSSAYLHTQGYYQTDVDYIFQFLSTGAENSGIVQISTASLVSWGKDISVFG